MVDFIRDHKALYGVEAICQILPIASSTYYRQLDLVQNPEKRSKRDLHDQHYAEQIKLIWQESHGRYGIRKVWQQLKQEGYSIARCTVTRLMKQLEIQGVWRGKNKRTTHHDDQQKRADDLVKRDLLNHIWTAKGERVMMPNFGTRIPVLAFEQNDETTRAMVENDLREVFEYDPRVRLLNLQVANLPDNNAIVAIVDLLYLEFDVRDTLNIEVPTQ
jgi:phage baseplate assembly protein W